jgi:hypothetical protein
MGAPGKVVKQVSENTAMMTVMNADVYVSNYKRFQKNGIGTPASPSPKM